MANSLLSKLGGMLGMGGDGASDGLQQDASGVDEAKALQYTQDRWNDLKNAYVVIHQ